MSLIADKQIIIDSFMRMAETEMLQRDYLIEKLQIMVSEGDLTEEEVKPIMDVLIPPMV